MNVSHNQVSKRCTASEKVHWTSLIHLETITILHVGSIDKRNGAVQGSYVSKVSCNRGIRGTDISHNWMNIAIILSENRGGACGYPVRMKLKWIWHNLHSWCTTSHTTRWIIAKIVKIRTFIIVSRLLAVGIYLKILDDEFVEQVVVIFL